MKRKKERNDNEGLISKANKISNQYLFYVQKYVSHSLSLKHQIRLKQLMYIAKFERLKREVDPQELAILENFFLGSSENKDIYYSKSNIYRKKISLAQKMILFYENNLYGLVKIDFSL